MKLSPTIVSTAVLLALAVSACHPSRPVVDPGPKPPNPRGTISGVLRASSNDAPLASRLVGAVNTETQARFEARTNAAGGFTLMVPPGTYRLEVELLAGEALVDDPGTLDVGEGDVDSNLQLKVAPKSQ